MAPTNTTSEPQAPPSAAAILLAAGLLTSVTSFFLPAVSDSHTTMLGWQCAYLTLFIPFQEAPNVLSLLMLACGLINPLAILSLILRANHAPDRWRGRIAFAGLALLLVCWLFLAMMHLTVAVGHVVWVAGLLLMLVPEVVQFARGERA